MYFDTHAHLDSFEDDVLAAMINRAEVAGVSRTVAIGGNEEANHRTLRIAAQYPGQIWAAVGYDRDQAAKNLSLDRLREQLEEPSVVAIGETGLDYYYEAETAAEQKALFSQMLELAREARKPVVVHSREADADTLELLREHAQAWKGAKEQIGVLHCFTGSLEFAREILELGMFVSLSGIISFKKAEQLQEVARSLPLESLLIETDTPYLAPVPFRGKPNEPAFVTHVAEALAKIRNDSPEHIAHITAQNGAKLFGLER